MLENQICSQNSNYCTIDNLCSRCLEYIRRFNIKFNSMDENYIKNMRKLRVRSHAIQVLACIEAERKVLSTLNSENDRV